MMIPEDVPNLTIKIWSHKCQKAAERIVIKIKGVAVDFWDYWSSVLEMDFSK